MVDFNKIKKLNMQIQALLQERPELQPLQDKIDKLRKESPNNYEFQRKLQELMLNTWNKSIKAWEGRKDLSLLKSKDRLKRIK